MDTKKKKALSKRGYKVGTVDEFLGLSSEESEYTELRLALSEVTIKPRVAPDLFFSNRSSFWLTIGIYFLMVCQPAIK